MYLEISEKMTDDAVRFWQSMPYSLDAPPFRLLGALAYTFLRHS